MTFIYQEVIMVDRPAQLKMRVNGREVMRVQGVYMYLISHTGEVGAVLGFHPLVIVSYEEPNDEDDLKGYLRVDRWVYPLARSFSPIFIWGYDRMIMPEPFSPVTNPVYVVIRFPLAMSRYQKDTLWNLLDIHAHVCGRFSYLTVEKIKAMDKLFELTEITSHDKKILDKTEWGESQPATLELPELSDPKMVHKLLAFGRKEARLSLCVTTTRKSLAHIRGVFSLKETKFGQTSATKRTSHSDDKNIKDETCGVLLPTDRFKCLQDDSVGGLKLYQLPPVRGNLIRLYVLGPRDLQHIKISTVLEWIPVTQIMYSAVKRVFREQIRQRHEKELNGIPPSFERRRQRLFGGWGAAEHLNAFGVAKKTKTFAEGSYIEPYKVDPAYAAMFQKALTIQDLESASKVFDYAIDECMLHLLNFSPVTNMNVQCPEVLSGPLVPRDLNIVYRKGSKTFLKLMTLSETLPRDLVYETYGPYLERVHEDCEHHYPKLRPRNPMLDPKYPYARLPTSYSIMS